MWRRRRRERFGPLDGRRCLRDRRGVKVGRPEADVKRADVLRLRKKGWSIREIARSLEATPSTIGRIVRDARQSDVGVRPNVA